MLYILYAIFLHLLLIFCVLGVYKLTRELIGWIKFYIAIYKNIKG